jgi:hypothetical protein
VFIPPPGIKVTARTSFRLPGAARSVTAVTLPPPGALYHAAAKDCMDFRAGRRYDRRKK